METNLKEAIAEKLTTSLKEFELVLSSEEEASGPDAESWDENYLEKFLRYDAIFRLASKELGFEYPEPKFDDPQKAMGAIHDSYMETKKFHFRIVSSTWSKKYEDEARVTLGIDETELSPAISFDEGSRKNITRFISQLREETYKCDWMSKEHQRRVVDAVNEVQSEVDRPVSGYHNLLGKLEDLGDSLGKAGKKAKPMFDRIEQVRKSVKTVRNEHILIEKQSEPLKITDQRNHENEQSD